MDSLATPSLGDCLSRAHRKDDQEATCLIGNNFNPVGESSHSPIVCGLPFQTRGLARLSARLMTPWTATSKTITWEGHCQSPLLRFSATITTHRATGSGAGPSEEMTCSANTSIPSRWIGFSSGPETQFARGWPVWLLICTIR
jgi:hypothetical protein